MQDAGVVFAHNHELFELFEVVVLEEDLGFPVATKNQEEEKKRKEEEKKKKKEEKRRRKKKKKKKKKDE